MTKVGTAIVDVTPPPGIAMAGFAARVGPARSGHDPLTVRALVVDETALVTVDVIGIDADMSRRARARASLPDGQVTIAATHTHGGPVSMSGRLSAEADKDYLARLEAAIVAAIENALSGAVEVTLHAGCGKEPGFAKNRRTEGGAVDRGVPVLRFDCADGTPLAFLVSYACHPVVLGADNRRWTADYPHFLRARIEAAHPGAVALFATGCAGDVNTGHSAAASLTRKRQPQRSYTMAKFVGEGIARSALKAELRQVGGGIGWSEVFAAVDFAQRETADRATLANHWRAASQSPGDIHDIWARWAETCMGRDLAPLAARCTALSWSGARIVALPGEIFAQTGLDIREALGGDGSTHIIAYADDNPGYIPPRDAYDAGGYEVEEAHRFYGMGATVAPGAAEALAKAALAAAENAANLAANQNEDNY